MSEVSEVSETNDEQLGTGTSLMLGDLTSHHVGDDFEVTGIFGRLVAVQHERDDVLDELLVSVDSLLSLARYRGVDEHWRVEFDKVAGTLRRYSDDAAARIARGDS